MIKKIIIFISAVMILTSLSIFIKVKTYLHKSEDDLLEYQHTYSQSLKTLDSLNNFNKEQEKLRILYAEKLESELRKNRKVCVTTSGHKNEYLTLTCYFFNDHTINEESIKNSINTWKKLGFKKIIITNGYENSYTLKLQ